MAFHMLDVVKSGVYSENCGLKWNIVACIAEGVWQNLDEKG
jgi:hypothetical protein